MCRGEFSENEALQLHNNSYFCFAATYRLTLLDSKTDICSSELPCSDVWLSPGGTLTGFEWSHYICGQICFSHWDFFSTVKPSLWLKWPKCGSKHRSASAMFWTGKELSRVSFVLMVAVFDHLDELQVFLNCS